MGRHSSSQQWPFYRSVVSWFLPWVLIAVVSGTAVWIAVDALGGGDLASPPLAAESESPSPSVLPSESESPTLVEETPKPEKTKEPEPKKTPSPEPEELITAGISVQVLNATNSPDADDAMADRLAQLGYNVVAVDSASRTYELTTVFWSSSAYQEAAERLARRFGWVAAPKPENLSSDVSIHVVVGLDEA
jgi:cell division septation protein DedD